MMSPKFFALSLLVVSSCAVARVQLSTHLEMSAPAQQSRTILSEVQLGANETAMVQKDDAMRLETRLLSEDVNEARVCYTISAKNTSGEYEVVAAPVLCAAYGQDAEIAIGSTNGDSLHLTLKAEKI